MKVYISGPMTGIADLNRPAFARAASYLRGIGHEPVNPHDIGDAGLSWEENMRRDLRELLDCESIYLLAGWQQSKGAQFEFYVARKLGFSVVFEEEVVEV